MNITFDLKGSSRARYVEVGEKMESFDEVLRNCSFTCSNFKLEKSLDSQDATSTN